MLWRGATEWPAFLTGRSMIVAGGLSAKMVVYPIAEGSRPDRKLTNWAVVARVGDGRRAAGEGGLVAARPARGADAACRALRDPACRRQGADRRDAGVLGISDVRPRSAAALVARPRDAARRRRASDVSGRLERRLAGDPRCALPRRRAQPGRAPDGGAPRLRGRAPAEDRRDRARQSQGRPRGRHRRRRGAALPTALPTSRRCCPTPSARRSCAAMRRRRASPRSR